MDVKHGFPDKWPFGLTVDFESLFDTSHVELSAHGPRRSAKVRSGNPNNAE